MPRSSEGYLWTPSASVEGLETRAVIPSSTSTNSDYDVVIIGAGFAGLIAARDISCHANLKVLLVEARDRIGGRTWTVKALGEDFEMGGTWVHWNQPHVYRELHRYSLHKNLKTSAGTFAPATTYYKSARDAVQELDIESSSARIEEIATAFFTLHGHTSRSLMPYPHDPSRLSPWKEYDHLSIRDRLDQMREFSESDKEMFEATVSSLGSARGTEIGFVELLRWYVLGGHSIAQMFELCGVYKIGKGGMTSLARAILGEYNGDVLMNAVVKEIQQNTRAATEIVKVLFEDGSEVRAKGVVSTVPLNCLSDVNFTPALSQLRQRAIQRGHINKGAKIHFKLSELGQPWFATCSSRSNLPFCFAFSDHNGTRSESHPDGTYCIGFGYNDCLGDKKDNKQIIQAFRECFRPHCDVQAYLTHDWMHDRFAKGVWSCWGAGSMSEYLEELQKTHGNIVFASADWADGWRGFVDGAIESGSKAARDILALLSRDKEVKVSAKL